MTVTVLIDDPAHEPGTEVYVSGLPLMKNGESYELTDEEEASFVAQRMMTIDNAFVGSQNISVSGTPKIKDVAEYLGVDPAEISSVSSVDPTVENKKVAEELGFPTELITVDGISTEPNVAGEESSEDVPADTTLPQQTGVLTVAHDAAADAALEQRPVDDETV